ncbi:MAG TPA: biopolymer transporter ExbD [Bryobacteraceae bacterium]|nr:biopolymer transporter ExbD [Bryobacteraceae bacterium]
MALSVNGGSNFGGSRRRGGNAALSEINVTPFVDVVLVLLIIFMLTAHIMDFGIEVDVPKTRYVKDTQKDMPVVTINRDGLMYLNEKEVNINDLQTTIRQRFGDAKGVFLKADKGTVWEVPADVMAELSHDGYQVNVVVQPLDTARQRK